MDRTAQGGEQEVMFSMPYKALRGMEKINGAWKGRNSPF